MGSVETPAGAQASGAHDLCFVVDGTGSMTSFLRALAQSLPQASFSPVRTLALTLNLTLTLLSVDNILDLKSQYAGAVAAAGHARPKTIRACHQCPAWPCLDLQPSPSLDCDPLSSSKSHHSMLCRFTAVDRELL